VDFSKYKAVKATPPADASTRANGPSPLLEVVKEGLKDSSWHGFMGVPTDLADSFVVQRNGEKRQLREHEVLKDEIRRAARQLDAGINTRVKMSDDGKTADVYFRAGAKRKYVRQQERTPESTQEVQTPATDGKGKAK